MEIIVSKLMCINNFSTARYFVDKTIEELQKQGGKKSDDEKGVLEKLLEINKDVAVIMASDMLFAGVDTVNWLTSRRSSLKVEPSKAVTARQLYPCTYGIGTVAINSSGTAE